MAGRGENAPAAKRPAVLMTQQQEKERAPKVDGPPSPQRPRAGILKNSPGRQAALTAQASGDGPTVVGMTTPPRDRAVPGTPPVPAGVPQKGCSTEELRVWVIEAIHGVGKDATDLEVRAAARINEVQAGTQAITVRLDALETLQRDFEGLRKDVNVFATVKNLVTQAELQKLAEAIENQLKGLNDQSNGFMTNLDQHLQQLNKLETEFKGHVENNFLAVERECNKIKDVVQGVHDGKGNISDMNLTAVQLQYSQISQQVGHMKASVEAENVAHRQELMEVKSEVTRANVAHRQELMEVKNEVTRAHLNINSLKDSADRLTANSSSIPGGKCHCEHLETLKLRVDDLERRFLQRPQQPPQGPDPWQNWQAPGGGQAPRAPQGVLRSPPGVQPGARRPSVANPDFPEMPRDLNNLFDDKIAISVGYAYDGDKHGEAWKRKVRGYWISKCPDILPILNFAEDLDSEELTIDALLHEANSYRWMTEVNVKRLGELIWGFLNDCLSGKARSCFEGADPLNGFDAWRRVVQHIHQGANVRLGTLRRMVKNPPQIAKIEDIDQGIVRFEAIMKDYKTAGGSPPEGAELKNDLLETLPMEIREGLMWRATELHETFGQFTMHVRNTANAILFHRGKAHSSPYNVGESTESPGGAEETYEEAMMALNRRFNRNGNGGGTRPGGQPPANPGGPRAPRPPRCVNCGGDHLAAQCTKARVDVADRPCYICGKPKHLARDCPDKKTLGNRGSRNQGQRSAVRTVTENEDDDYFGLMDLKDTDGFTKIPVRQWRKPQPTERTLGSFMPPRPLKSSVSLKNSFSGLDCRDQQCRSPDCRARAPTKRTIRQIKQETRREADLSRDFNVEDCEEFNIIGEEIDVVAERASSDDEQIMMATEEVKIAVAADTGAVAHCAAPRHLPDTVSVDQSDPRDFTGADGAPLKHFGNAKVRMKMRNGKHVSNTVQVMNVCRPLHSVSTITDNEYDMLFTKKAGIVVPAGAFDEILKKVKRVAEYPRKGGLYIAEMTVKDPAKRDSASGSPATFAGQGAGR